MTRFNAGERAKAGYYFSAKSWEVHPVPADGERLPGEAGQHWYAIPTAAALVLTPLLGLTFLMFLPFIGFYLTIEAALRPLLRVFRREASELAATMSPGWQPGEAHLTGKPAGKGAGAEGEAAPGEELEKLAREIEARRSEKK
jgi:hypothetical protein